MNTKKTGSIALKVITIIFFTILFVSCDSNALHKTPIKNFAGTWELQGRAMFNGIRIKITQDKSGNFVGKVVKLNDDKYVDMFVNVGDTWVTGISRLSNFEFNLSEKKIAYKLFSLYGLDTTQDYKAEFIDINTIGLGTGSSAPSESSVKYVRVTSPSPEK